MPVLTANNPTLQDWNEATDMDGRVGAIIELLHQTNEIMQHITFYEGNLVTGHRVSVRTGIPRPTWRRLYQGVDPVKSSRATVTDTCGMMETYNDVDKALADLNDQTAAFRTSEARATIEGFTQELSETIFYGNTVASPEKFDGLAVRYNDTTAANAENLIDGGAASGQTDCGSIWLIAWHPETCMGIVPKGSQMGLQITDKGQETLYDENGKPFEGYRMHFRWDCGMSVPDWRYIVRIHSIDRSTLTVDPWNDGGAILPDLMFEALERFPSSTPSGARVGFYMDREIRTKFRQQLANGTKQSTLEYQNIGGHRVASWNETTIHRVDSLAVDEVSLN